MHHRYFECNYAGTGAGFMDVFFGTFVNRFKENSPQDVKARADAKASLKGVPSLQFISYMFLAGLSVLPWSYFAVKGVNPGVLVRALAAFSCGFGPVLVACCFTMVRDGWTGLLAPFEKRSLFDHGLHLIVGTLFCSVPIAVSCFLALAPASARM
eukprot:TRINITY_DN11253_c0_g2_i2.p1 TRINITY_DN11253_c0_g2~~TRINITY_DN11253_c0_g2_i2.p1  ORF type:complete len:155 (-),score=42.49 TRINITY_DN11253_c0_g2_i2:216-680(-)